MAKQSLRIVLLGGGTVGSSVADLLCSEGHEVTLVDSDKSRTRMANEELDVGVVTGSASRSTTLFQANVAGADLCLAVTGSDEVNLIAASLSKSMGAHRSVARVFAPVYLDSSTFDYAAHFNIDRLLSLERLAAAEFACSIRNPGSVTVENLAHGKLEVQELKVSAKAKSSGVDVKSLNLPSTVRLGAIVRDGKTWLAGANDVLEQEDRVTLIGKRGELDSVRSLFQKSKSDKKRVFIAGGGETGYHLARTLEGLRFTVTMMELSPERCEFLAKRLKTTTVVEGDATRRAVLDEEQAGKTDFFVACMGADEENIMACVEAREIGAGSTMALIGRPDYAGVVGKLGIDVVITPREVMAREILSYLNTGCVISRSPLANSSIQIMEFDVNEGAPIAAQPLASLDLPPQCLITAMLRDDQVTIPGAKDQLKPGDSVVTLVDESSVNDLMKLFVAP